jgi:hypothetical protein
MVIEISIAALLRGLSEYPRVGFQSIAITNRGVSCNCLYPGKDAASRNSALVRNFG